MLGLSPLEMMIYLLPFFLYFGITILFGATQKEGLLSVLGLFAFTTIGVLLNESFHSRIPVSGAIFLWIVLVRPKLIPYTRKKLVGSKPQSN